METRTQRLQAPWLAWLAVAALAVASVPAARAETWTIDPVHSHVGFKVRHMMVSNVEGVFHEVSGTITGDPSHPENARVEATIDASTVDTGWAKRDDDLRSPNFFEVAKYPTITFVSKAIRNWKDTSFEVVGDLTIHGVTKEVVLQVSDLTPAVTDPGGHQRRGMTATTTINRKDFGMEWNKALDSGGAVVGDEVRITLELEVHKEA